MCRQASLELAAEPASAAVARRFVGDCCTDWGLQALCDDLVLPVSELVTNGVLHARTAVTITVSLAGAYVEVAVRDRNPRPPVLRPVHLDLDGDLAALGLDAEPGVADAQDARPHVADAGVVAAGRGMRIVDAVADEWGVAELARGKDVWFRLRCPDQWQPPSPCRCSEAPDVVSPGGLDVALR